MSQILSPNKYDGRRTAIRLIVLHTMEVDETDPNVAEAVGNYFAKPATQASSHVGIDFDSECRYVIDEDTAWAAPGCNADGLQAEMAGRAGQSDLLWKDAASLSILERTALRVAMWCEKWNIPPVRLSNAELKAGKPGIIDHNQASQVYGGSHWDVGPNFPWASFLARVRALIGAPIPPVVAPKPTKAPATRIKLAVDGNFGPRSKARLQQWAGAPVDSILGPVTWRCVQRKFGQLVVDGSPGKKTWTRIQQVTGAVKDGDPGPDTYRHLQQYLNTH